MQTLVRSAEDELNDPVRRELKAFIREDCGIGTADEETIDTIANIVISSSITICCGKSHLLIGKSYLFIMI